MKEEIISYMGRLTEKYKHQDLGAQELYMLAEMIRVWEKYGE